MRISDWSSDVCSSDLFNHRHLLARDVVPSASSIRPLIALSVQALVETGSDAAAHRTETAAQSMAPASVHRDALKSTGRASCRERMCQYVEILVVAVLLKKNTTTSIKRHCMTLC